MSLDTLPADFDKLRDTSVALLTDLETQRQQAVTSQADCAAELNRVRDANTSLQATLAKAVQRVNELEAGGGNNGGGTVTPYTAGMTIANGGFYKLPDAPTPIGIIIEPGVKTTFLGGTVYPQSTPAFTVRPGGTLILVGVTFHCPNPPLNSKGERSMPACVLNQGTTSLLDCTFGTVGEGVKIWPEAESTLVARCTAGDDVYSALVGCWGAPKTAIVFTTGKDSVTENLVRFSPQAVNGVDAVPSGAVVAFCDLANTRKSAIDFRHVDGAVAFRNRLTADDNHAAVGMGNDKDVSQHGARGVYVIENDIPGGSIIGYPNCDRITIDGNRPLWKTRPSNNFITVNAVAPSALKDLRITNNKGPAVVAQKPMVSYFQGAKPAQLDERENAWVPVP